MRQAVRHSDHGEPCDCNSCLERRYPRRPGHFWTWLDPARREADGPPLPLLARVLTVASAVTGLIVGLTASWLLLLVLLATAFVLLVAIVVLLFTSFWPWVILGPLVFAAMLFRSSGRLSGHPREPRDIRESS